MKGWGGMRGQKEVRAEDLHWRDKKVKRPISLLWTFLKGQTGEKINFDG